MTAADRVGAVVIGRNEGERLVRCLEALPLGQLAVVYVDSGSTDSSVAAATRLGVPVVELDGRQPFTAARARNAGLRALTRSVGAIDFVQFIDGDCELHPGWLESAGAFLSDAPDVAIVCGRLCERFPERSVYNRLCQLEWDTPAGDVRECGGIFMVRVGPFLSANGFREDLIAGEESDLCGRLRKNGWKIHKLTADMAWHDAAMTRLSQWWARNRRSGYALAQACRLRAGDEPGLRRKVISNVVWALPPAWFFWPLLGWRMYRQRGAAYAVHIVAGKIPHLLGQVAYWRDRVRGRTGSIIEYK